MQDSLGIGSVRTAGKVGWPTGMAVPRDVDDESKGGGLARTFCLRSTSQKHLRISFFETKSFSDSYQLRMTVL
jgi:hypothetical protein